MKINDYFNAGHAFGMLLASSPFTPSKDELEREIEKRLEEVAKLPKSTQRQLKRYLKGIKSYLDITKPNLNSPKIKQIVEAAPKYTAESLKFVQGKHVSS